MILPDLKGWLQKLLNSNDKKKKTADKSIKYRLKTIDLRKWPMNVLVLPSYYGCQLGIAQQIETDEFCLQKRLKNKISNCHPALFDMFNILIGTTHKNSPYNLLAHLSMCRCPVELVLYLLINIDVCIT